MDNPLSSVTPPLRVLLLLVGAIGVSLRAQSTVDTISQADLVAGLSNGERWVTFSGDYTGQRHSPLTQITPANVAQLAEQWTFDSALPVRGRGTEATPLYFGGRLYVTGLAGHAWALDARTGKPSWTYRREYPSGMVNCCGAINRGFAVLGDTLYMGTIDARLIAVSVKDGAVIWESPVADGSKGYSVTMAPLVVKDKVIVGVSGSEFPTRGFIDAYDARTGERAWRFYTVPAPGEPGSSTWSSADAMAKGGGGVWVSGSYDPDLNLVFYGTGNPNPAYYGQDRLGDNLYTSSLVALDADTGKLRWHYQFTPHDLHDWDAAQVPVLATLPLKQGMTKVVMAANRNGLFYVLERATGKVLLARPFVQTMWATGVGPDGRPVVPSDLGSSEVCVPDHRGATNFPPPSFDPVRGLFFVTARETCAVYSPGPPAPPPPDRVTMTMGRGPQRVSDRDSYLVLRAIEASTGEKKWEVPYTPLPSTRMLAFGGGVMSTAAGLVFASDDEGNFRAVSASDGRVLWHAALGASPAGAAPMSHMMDGRQWVVIAAGARVKAFALPSR
jgi:alcohol dehydrogenase (cytochrome c)